MIIDLKIKYAGISYEHFLILQFDLVAVEVHVQGLIPNVSALLTIIVRSSSFLLPLCRIHQA